ncbi:CHAT domain-containing protein [Streptomyces sp. NPDC053493]|uniref:CHAT domain-containing protein n=1 Tax=Streptomyces sp. NPDC053493 TaxID=3365705 RepID=UPI0037D125AE
MRIGLWILGAVYAAVPGVAAVSVYLDGPPADMTTIQLASMILFGPVVAGTVLRAAYDPLIAEAWRHTPPLLRVLLPLLYGALFALLCFAALAARTALLGPGFDLFDSPRQWWTGSSEPIRHLWLLMIGTAVPMLVWTPLVHYEGPQLLLRAGVFLAAGKAIDEGDTDTIRRLTEPLRKPRRLPSVTAYNEAVVASLDSLVLLNRLGEPDGPESLDACLVAARHGLAGMQALPGRYSRKFLWRLRDALGDALWERHLDTLSSAALDEVILIRREVVAAPRWTKGVDDRPYLLQLSEALGARFDASGDERDLREAVAWAERAVRSRPLGKGPSVEALRVLGAQHVRAAREGIDAPAAWQAAVTALREGVALEERTGGRNCRFQLAVALLETPREGPRAAALAEAEELARDLADRAKPGSRSAGEYHSLLAMVLLEQIDEDPEPVPALWEACAGASRSAAENAALPAQMRLYAARMWGLLAAATAVDIAAGRVTPDVAGDTAERLWASGAEGLGLAVELMPLVAWRGVAHHDQRTFLADLHELAVDAAAAAVGAGRPERAVELLERGRTVMWSQLLDLRTTELSRLRAEDPETFARLDAIREELDSALPAGEEESPEAAERRTALAREWETRVRRAGLLRPADYATLRAAAADGPVVVVNISELGCHALIVRSEGPVSVVPLDALTHGDVRDLLDRTARADERLVEAHAALRAARAEAHGTAAGDTDAVEAAEALVIRAEMRRTQASARMLDRLWERLARPVLDALPELDRDGATEQCRDGGTEHGRAYDTLPRLWWCPTGLATYLPLHAAGARRGGARDSVPGRVVPSYAPTLTSLLHARRPPARTDAPGRLLLVTVPEPDLPEVAAEAEVVARHVPSLRRLHDEHATVTAVTRLLPDHTRLHTVCHGIAREGLRLGRGEILTPLQLSRVPARDAEFAFLSACDTAVPDPDVLDEATHPAAVLHFAGFRHVLASLYPVQDASAPAVTDAVYARLTRGDGELDASRAPRALHAALTELRAAHPHQPKIWMPYIHVGA